MVTLTHKPTDGRLIQGFGPRPKPTPTSPDFHYGQDWGWNETTTDPIYAVAAGVVEAYADAGAYGRRLVVRHSDGSRAWYCHTTRAHVRVGETVNAGQHVADIGETGNTVGPHLHLEIRVNGIAVDPAPLFDLSGPAGLDPTPLEETMKRFSHLDKRPRDLTPGVWTNVYLNDDNGTSFAHGKCLGMVSSVLQVDGLKIGEGLKVRLLRTKYGTNDERAGTTAREIPGTTGTTFASVTDTFELGADDDGIRVQVLTDSEGVRLLRTEVTGLVQP